MADKEKKEQSGGMREDGWVFFENVFLTLLIWIGGYFLLKYIGEKSYFWSTVFFFLWISLSLFYPVYVALFKFAPKGIFITQVEEGTSRVVMKMGQARRGLVQYRGYDIDGDWNIFPTKPGKEKKRLFGGIRWVGLWPFSYIHNYVQRWTSIRENGETTEHEERLNSVLLKEKIYHLSLKGVEDKDGIPIDIDIIVTLKVVNVYKALFGPHNYLEQVLNRIRPLFREYVGGYSFMDLKSQKQRAGGEIWKRLQKEDMVNTFDEEGDILQKGEFERDYGVRIKGGGIEIKNISPPDKYQTAQTKKYLAEREAERVAGETIGAVINMMATSRGISAKEIQKKIKSDESLQKEFGDFCKEVLHKKMAIDGSSYVKVDVSGADGMEKSLIELISVYSRMPMGGGSKKKKERDKPKQIKDLSVDKKRKALRMFKEKGGSLTSLLFSDDEDDEEENE